MNRKVFLYIAVMATFIGCSGEQKTPDAVIIDNFTSAMNALENRDYDSYLKHVDFGCEIDSIQRLFFSQSLAQHLERREHHKGALVGMQVLDVSFSSDSVCDVYYEMTYADSAKEVSSQKMARIDGVWKIRIRN